MFCSTTSADNEPFSILSGNGQPFMLMPPRQAGQTAQSSMIGSPVYDARDYLPQKLRRWDGDS